MQEEESYIFTPSHLLTLTPLPPSPLTNSRRLSARFTKPTSPVKAHLSRDRPQALAWVSLQGRLVGAEEATSARAIGGGLSENEALAWELFSPMQRVLIVAVVAVAAAKSEKNRQIRQLKNCVQLRDQILMSMQQKLDGLCEQMNCIKDQPQSVANLSVPKTVDSLPCKSDSICTDCWLCDQHRAQLYDVSGNSLLKAASNDEMFRNRLSLPNEAEQEERRMSDLSDWASSVTSAADIQLNNLAIEQDIYNLKRECEDKDAAIKELSTFIRSKDVATSKRIEELEEIIRRKNTIITKLRKDMIVLEQKVVNLTRMRRRSFSGPSLGKKQSPSMTDNLLYDMDSPTSSSDSDCSSKKQNTSAVKDEVENSVATPVKRRFTCENVLNRNQNANSSSEKQNTSIVINEVEIDSPVKRSFHCENVLNRNQDSESSSEKQNTSTIKNEVEIDSPVHCSFSCENVSRRNQKSAPAKLPSSSAKISPQVPRSRPVSPLTEKSMNQRYNSAASSRLSQASGSAGSRNSRRRNQNVSKDAASAKRWM